MSRNTHYLILLLIGVADVRADSSGGGPIRRGLGIILIIVFANWETMSVPPTVALSFVVLAVGVGCGLTGLLRSTLLGAAQYRNRFCRSACNRLARWFAVGPTLVVAAGLRLRLATDPQRLPDKGHSPANRCGVRSERWRVQSGALLGRGDSAEPWTVVSALFASRIR